MKRLAILAAACLSLAVPATASAFHHTGLPATFCHASLACPLSFDGLPAAGA